MITGRNLVAGNPERNMKNEKEMLFTLEYILQKDKRHLERQVSHLSLQKEPERQFLQTCINMFRNK
jgi:hypothetical protein